MLNLKGTVNSFGLPMTLFDSPLSIMNNSSNFSPGSISPSPDKSWMSVFKGGLGKSLQSNTTSGGLGSPNVSLSSLSPDKFKYESPLSGKKPDLLDPNKSWMPKDLPSKITPQSPKKDLGSFLGGNFNKLVGKGAQALKGFGSSTGLGTSDMIGIGGDIVGMGLDALGVKKTDAQNQNGFDKLLGMASDLPIPDPIIKSVLVGADLINQYAGRTSKKQGTSDMGYLAGYGYADTNLGANTKFGFSDTVLGWFGNSKRENTNKLTNMYDKLNTLKSIGGYYGAKNQLAANNSMSHISQKNQQQLYGGTNTRMIAAKKGAKIPPATLRNIVNKVQRGAKVTNKLSFEEWYKTIPKEKNDTANYRLKYGYENNLIPQEELDNFVKNPDAHLFSAYFNPKTKKYDFLKSKKHPTIQLELDWYNSDDAKDFRKQYKLYDDGSDYYQYVPLEKFKKGGAVNVIPDGAFHSRKHSLPDEIAEQVTAKGIPVVSEEDGGKLKQHAEVERNEIIFHKKTTETIENLLMQYNNAESQKEKDDLAIQCGKFIADEILVNTKDNTGLIDSI